MKSQQATDIANTPTAASGTITIEANVHVFQKGEENGFCEWFGCEFISVIGLIEGKNLIELNYTDKETVFVSFDAIRRCENSVYFCVDTNIETDSVLEIYKVARFVYHNCKGVLSVKE